MKFDVSGLIGAVERKVTEGEREGRATRSVVATRVYETSIEDAWDALTNAARIPRWFLPISGELRQGGRYQLQGNAGGEIMRCEPPRALDLTWEFGAELTWVSVRLDVIADERTRLTLEHTAYVDDERNKKYGPGAVGVGWDLTLLGLGLYLQTGAAKDPAEVAAWSGSSEGKDFMRKSSEFWGRAAVAAGADRADAEAAAARTTAAYTGEPAPEPSQGLE